MPTVAPTKKVNNPSNLAMHCTPACVLSQWGLCTAIVFSYLILALQADLRLAIPLLIAVTAGVMILICICLYTASRYHWHVSPGQVMVVAILIRAFFVLRPPELSDDLFRYLWDGLRLLSGHNPYGLPPAAVPAHEAGPAALLARVNHADLTTIYPPAAQWVFTAGAALKSGLIGIKTVLVIFDVMTCALIVRLLRIMEQPSWLAMLYAWHPLAVLEIAASGHIDAAGMLFLVVAIYLLVGQPQTAGLVVPRAKPQWSRVFIAGVCYSMAVLTKLFPLVFFPGMLILAGRSRCIVFCIGITVGSLALALPFFPDIQNAWATLSLYARTWEFSGFLYRCMRLTPLSGIQTRCLIGGGFAVALFVAYRPIGTRRPPIADTLDRFRFLALTFLLLTPTLHPWYALYLVLFLPFSPASCGIVLSWAVLLAYRVLIPYALLGRWIEDDLTPFLIFAAPVAAWLLQRLTADDPQYFHPRPKNARQRPADL
ncbi:hypothetical protein [Desulfosarcina ovata]|uniref:DUF2029 domain-containing protein n=1 Tax=Desulfosarcina ovata subsp. ovata TaxID=2752305 RepID=A0A5K8AGD8_9BACT|nr:hypothetical protein [Desulfosarcina ovata]BBO91753.1 hypothetical protein DSCOOX_49330 [Desulfosarcina ovata subsp. ovata]